MRERKANYDRIQELRKQRSDYLKKKNMAYLSAALFGLGALVSIAVVVELLFNFSLPDTFLSTLTCLLFLSVSTRDIWK